MPGMAKGNVIKVPHVTALFFFSEDYEIYFAGTVAQVCTWMDNCSTFSRKFRTKTSALKNVDSYDMLKFN